MQSTSRSASAYVPPTLDAGALRAQAVKEGMRPLRLAEAMKVTEGQTTSDEVLRSTPSTGT